MRKNLIRVSSSLLVLILILSGLLIGAPIKVQAAGPYIFYMDYANGTAANDAAEATPLGWWKVTFTLGTGNPPSADDAVTGATSGHHGHLTVYTLGGGTWAGADASGTLYFYGMDDLIHTGEQVDWHDGHGHTDVDATYCAWKSMTTGPTAARIAAGDIIRIAKSPASTNIGNATWNQASKTVTLATAGLTKAIDLCETAWTAVTGLITVLNAAPTTAGLNYAVGDTFLITTGGTGAIGRVTSITAGTGAVTGVAINTGGNGGYTTGASKVTSKITGGGDNNLTVNITTIASAVVTRTAVATDAKQGSYSMKIAAPAGVLPGSKLAYYAVAPGTLASYQKASYWIKNSVAITANQWRWVLCTGTIGEAVVDEFKIPAIASAARWLPLTQLSTAAGNLGASTASIAVYSDTVAPTSASSIILDDIIGCTTSGLNLQSLISKNSAAQGGTEGFYGIQSISATTVLLDTDTNTKGNSGRGYYGATGAGIATYIRETIKTDLGIAGGTVIQEVQDSGAAGSNIEYQGGYDTALNTQIGETFYDGLNGFGYGLYATAKSYNTFNYLNTYRYGAGYYFASNCDNNTFATISNSSNNTAQGIVIINAAGNTFTTISNANNNTSAGVYISGLTSGTFTTISNANSNGGNGCTIASSSNVTFTTISEVSNNVTHGISLDTGNFMTFTTIASVSMNAGMGIYFRYLNNSVVDTISLIDSRYAAFGIQIASSNYNVFNTITNIISATNTGMYVLGNFNVFNTIGQISTSTFYGLTLNGAHYNTFNLISNLNNCGIYGLGFVGSTNNTFNTITNCNNNTSYGIQFQAGSHNNTLRNVSTSGNGTSAISIQEDNNYFYSSTFAEEAVVSGYANNQSIYSQKEDGTAGNNWIYTYGGSINSQAVTRAGASGLEWKSIITSSVRTSIYPLTLSVAKVAVSANKLVTVSAYLTKSSGTDIEAYIVCKKGQILGDCYTVDAQSTPVGNTTAATLKTITFTPTEAGVVEILFGTYYMAGNASCLIDTMSISQVP